MTNLSPDVRDSTLRSLKLTCPSAEVVHDDVSPASTVSPSMGHLSQNPFVDPDAEWSDEEELIPRNTRRRVQYIPPHVKITTTSESSSEASTEEYSPRLSVNGSPLIPPKSPSRPSVKSGGSHDDLVQRFYQVTRERDALRKELQRKSLGPDGIPARAASMIYKSDEKTLIEELHALRYEIRIWSEEYFSGAIKTSSKRPHLQRAKDLFGNLSDNYNTYLKHPDDRPLLIQAYVWSKLQQKVFSNWQKGSGYIWAGKLGDRKLRAINDTLRKAVKNEEEAEQYHHWRAMTVNMLVPQVDGKWRPTFDAAPVLKRISRFCSRIRHKLRPWSTRSLREGKEQLHTIISASVALDLKMKRQRADYRFVTFTGGRKDQYYGYGFYESEMEDVYDEEEDDHHRSGRYGSSGSMKGRNVELALAPALERCGNANGHVFDQSFILVKADVSCHRVERIKKKKPAKPGVKKGVGAVKILGMWT